MENDKKKVLIATGTPFDLGVRDKMANTLISNGLGIAILEDYPGWQLKEEVQDINYLIVRSDRVDKKVIDNAPNLELIVRAGSGMDAIDVDYARQKGIEVENTNGANAASVAELAIGMMITLARDLHIQNKVADGIYQHPNFELFDKKIGIHGFGAVGVQVARRADALGLRIFSYDVNPNVDYNQFGLSKVNGVKNLEEVYRFSQIVSIHVPLTEETKGKIDYGLISLMKTNGILINTARPRIVDYDGLAKVMEENPEFKYAADVSKNEYRDFIKKNGLEKFRDRIFLTAKIGAGTYEANYHAGIQAARKVIGHKERMEKVITADTYLQ